MLLVTLIRCAALRQDERLSHVRARQDERKVAQSRGNPSILRGLAFTLILNPPGTRYAPMLSGFNSVMPIAIRLVIAVALRFATPSMAVALITWKNSTPSRQSKLTPSRLWIATVTE